MKVLLACLVVSMANSKCGPQVPKTSPTLLSSHTNMNMCIRGPIYK